MNNNIQHTHTHTHSRTDRDPTNRSANKTKLLFSHFCSFLFFNAPVSILLDPSSNTLINFFNFKKYNLPFYVASSFWACGSFPARDLSTSLLWCLCWSHAMLGLFVCSHQMMFPNWNSTMALWIRTVRRICCISISLQVVNLETICHLMKPKGKYQVVRILFTTN